MRLPLVCLMVIGIGMVIDLGGAQRAMAAPVAPNPELGRILQHLAGSATQEQYRQIDTAVKASPRLIEQLNRLASSGKLTEIVVLTAAAAASAPKPGPFNTWINGSSMVFTDTLLSQLTRNREYDVVSPDDVLPNNTTFVLAHLAFHLQAGKIAITPGGAPTMNDYVAALLDQEARAFIQAWNDTLDAAVQGNNQPLTPRQIAKLMFNMRYRFALLKALRQPSDPIRLEQDGVIADNELNAKGITTALKTSSVADIQ